MQCKDPDNELVMSRIKIRQWRQSKERFYFILAVIVDVAMQYET